MTIEVDVCIDTNCKSPLQEEKKDTAAEEEEKRIIRSSFFSSSTEVHVCVWQL